MKSKKAQGLPKQSWEKRRCCRHYHCWFKAKLEIYSNKKKIAWQTGRSVELIGLYKTTAIWYLKMTKLHTRDKIAPSANTTRKPGCSHI